ncbi:lipoyl protein ligase domain-containing protein [Polyangium spumosum]|uniref:BPL/LPL catalytic domain-containing protein n=1 Tax=Polyangium spumosum TaxID=889282 RepID=A0A6N7PQW7_9BACT|nr:hypothetical protein [Polyangium spumosum]MRG92615.1 hypothetical protein [Polyangium spumosum]
MHAIEPKKRPIPEALALGPALLGRAEQAQAVHVALSLVDGPAVVLGAAQRAGRVVELAACTTRGVVVLRRATTGTAAWLGGRGLVVTLALPHVAALVADATPRTLLNRNVRPLLRGFSHAGALAHYFGREWISLRKRPAALLGFDVTPSGAVLIEVFVGHDEPIALPTSLTSVHERALDRFGGKQPTSLSEIMPSAAPEAFAHALLEGFLARVEEPATALAQDTGELDTSPFAPITSALDPVPEAFVLHPAARVPIGWLESASTSPEGGERHVWLGGDVLAPRFALDRIAHGDAPPPDIPLEGATLADLVARRDLGLV